MFKACGGRVVASSFSVNLHELCLLDKEGILLMSSTYSESYTISASSTMGTTEL